MICKYCGSSYEENDKFCPICGRSTTGELEPVAEIPVYQPQVNTQADMQETIKNSKNSIAITSFVLGMLNFVGLGFLGVNLASIILGIFGLKSNRKGFAIAGIIISIICMLFTILATILFVVLLFEENIYNDIYTEFGGY